MSYHMFLLTVQAINSLVTWREG